MSSRKGIYSCGLVPTEKETKKGGHGHEGKEEREKKGNRVETNSKGREKGMWVVVSCELWQHVSCVWKWKYCYNIARDKGASKLKHPPSPPLPYATPHRKRYTKNGDFLGLIRLTKFSSQRHWPLLGVLLLLAYAIHCSWVMQRMIWNHYFSCDLLWRKARKEMIGSTDPNLGIPCSSKAADRSKPKRLYQVWKGANVSVSLDSALVMGLHDR